MAAAIEAAAGAARRADGVAAERPVKPLRLRPALPVAIGAEAEEKAYAACAVAGDPPEMGPDLNNRSVAAAGAAALVAAPAEVAENQVA